MGFHGGIDKMYNKFIKRLIDVLICLSGGLILLPFMLIISVLIFVDDPGKIIFKQERIGKDGVRFWLYKFRSMKIDTPDVPTHLLENPDKYITKIGKVLRMTSLDELPQIWNILKGEMSIIGPRPALWNQGDLNELRCNYGVDTLRPGLTGWAQINGRDELSIEEKVKYDAEYLENLSFIFDVKCFFATIVSVLKSDGVVEGKTEESKEKVTK